MKRLIYLLIVLSLPVVGFSQDFDKNIATARSAYAAGDLEDARFAMQQMLNDLDMAIGREVLKMLPSKMGALSSNSANDNVTANTGLTGVIIHRDYGSGEKVFNLDLMSNSPLVASINAILSIPFIGNSGDGTQKVIKIDGYKGMLQKSVDEETKKTDYTLQVPIGSTLLTFTAPDTNEAEMIKMANTIPLSQITKLVQ
ncbi:MAG TPA: hypothetical protein VFT90_03380 [Chryseosolibacter sp.]|nr:hypothetical protein [Chryseosolibacter sp.]